MTPLLRHDWDMIKGDAGQLWQSVKVLLGDLWNFLCKKIGGYQ
jgi:hypothetical protein